MAALLAGCAAHKATTSSSLIADGTTVAGGPQIAPVPDTAFTEPRVLEPAPVHTSAELIAEAKAACADGDFAAANLLLNEAVAQIQADMDPTDTALQAQTDFQLDEIVSLYATSMPREYLDSIPEEVSVTVYDRMMEQSIDSMSATAAESLAVARIFFRKDVAYDFPMAWNDRVYKSLLYLSQGKKGPFSRWLERSDPYMHFMRAMFADSGLPADLAYLPLIESGFSTQAYSRARASGIWQFIQSTGKRYGLRSGYWLDERRDPALATAAAISYLKKLHGDFGDWHCALAAYNCGEGGLARAVRRAGQSGTPDFWSLKLHKETMHYVPQFIAALILAKNRERFGLPPADTLSMRYAPGAFDTAHISDCIEMQGIADGISVSIDELKSINPHIVHFCTPPDVNDVTLNLPRGKRDIFKDYYASIPPESKISWFRYKITRGDNLGSISRHFKIPIAALKSINSLNSNKLRAGRYLLIPIPVAKSPAPRYAVASPDTATSAKADEPPEAAAFREKGLQPLHYKVRPGETIAGVGQLFRISTDDIRRWNRLSATRKLHSGDLLTLYVVFEGDGRAATLAAENGRPDSSGRATYAVRGGDNLSAISRRLQVPVRDLMTWNHLDNGNLIRPGDRLVYFMPVSQPAASDTAARPQETPAPVTATAPASDSAGATAAAPAPATPIAAGIDDPAKLAWSADTSAKSPEDSAAPLVRPAASMEQSTASTRKQADIAAAVQPRMIRYKVQRGDNISSLSSLFGVSMDEIMRTNNLAPDSRIRTGQIVRIPDRSAASGHRPRRKLVYYKVKQGDTLWGIARDFGIPLVWLRQANGLCRGTQLKAGEIIKVIASK
jgi:membrane-bound lytic murein transglycosylase D